MIFRFLFRTNLTEQLRLKMNWPNVIDVLKLPLWDAEKDNMVRKDEVPEDEV